HGAAIAAIRAPTEPTRSRESMRQLCTDAQENHDDLARGSCTALLTATNRSAALPSRRPTHRITTAAASIVPSPSDTGVAMAARSPRNKGRCDCSDCRDDSQY